MSTVWKWPLSRGVSKFDMPQGARVLTVQSQGGQAYLWALVDPGAERDRRVFRTCGTGESLSGDPGEYVGTFQISPTSSGIASLAFHVFEQTGSGAG